MTICQGDVVQKMALQKSTMGEYCTKLEYYIDQIATPSKQRVQDFVARGRDKRKK